MNQFGTQLPNNNNNLGENTRDRVAADKRTLSAAFLQTAPKSIREWSVDTVSAWLKEVFEGADDLPR